MVNEQLNIKNPGFWETVFPAPVVFTACTAIAVFYLCCALQSYFSPFIVFFFFLFSVLGFIFMFACYSFLKKKKKTSVKPIKILLYIFAGFAAGMYAFLRLFVLYSPVLSLAETEKAECIQCILTGEAVPAGTKYYSAEAKLLSCSYKNAAEFSAKGNIKVFFPAEMVKQNNAFSITAFKSKKENACKNFSKGAILAAEGKFGTKKDKITPAVFFIGGKIPEFLGWNSFFSGLRARFRFNLMRLLAGWGGAGGLLLALLSANKDFLETVCSFSFKNAGLAHILALSGMHVSLVSLAAIRMGTVFGKRSFAIKFSLISIVLFVWFAGSAPSLNRALGMMIILVVGKSLALKPDMLAVLSTMLIAHILIKPADALSLGFMLSYGALAGILLFGGALIEILRGKIPPKLLGGVSASLGAQAFTAPAVITKIGILAPIGIIASVIISPIVSFFLILGMASVFFAFLFPFTGVIFNFILNFLYKIIVMLAQFFAAFPLLEAQTLLHKTLFSCISFTAGFIMIKAAYIIKKNRAEGTF